MIKRGLIKEEILTAYNDFSYALSRDEIIEAINDNGTSFATSDELAALYAFDASTDNQCEEERIAHLEILIENRAKFNFANALEIANHLASE
jgi:hypothetical protein